MSVLPRKRTSLSTVLNVSFVPVTDITLPTTKGLRQHTPGCSRSNLPEQFGRPSGSFLKTAAIRPPRRRQAPQRPEYRTGRIQPEAIAGYLIFDPAWKPITWKESDLERGIIWIGAEAIEKMRLTDAVLARTGFDLDVILGEQIRNIQQVLRIPPVADVMETTASAFCILHQRNIMSERRSPDPSPKF
jgi:hypothetical protein